MPSDISAELTFLAKGFELAYNHAVNTVLTVW